MTKSPSPVFEIPLSSIDDVDFHRRIERPFQKGSNDEINDYSATWIASIGPAESHRYGATRVVHGNEIDPPAINGYQRNHTFINKRLN